MDLCDKDQNLKQSCFSSKNVKLKYHRPSFLSSIFSYQNFTILNLNKKRSEERYTLTLKSLTCSNLMFGHLVVKINKNMLRQKALISSNILNFKDIFTSNDQFINVIELTEIQKICEKSRIFKKIYYGQKLSVQCFNMCTLFDRLNI
jgi:hypothetical protein